jgi:single-stranded-DNA-specific exonuclease
VPQNLDISQAIASRFGYSSLTSRILAARGFVPDTISSFMVPTLKHGLPSVTALRGIKDAGNLIHEAVSKREVIALCSDFDVDGLTGSAQLLSFFEEIGVSVFALVPNRFTEGYGLNSRIIDEAHRRGASLLIAIDYGTKNRSELERARACGLKSIVIDHHHVGDEDLDLPCEAFINPQHPECRFAEGLLSASGLCWYLIAYLRSVLPAANSVDPRQYLDLSALGTICDMVPLIGVNRVLAKRGLEVLSESTRPGIIALKEVLGLKRAVRCHDVGFGLGPRINAAGRLSSGEVVLQLLSAKTLSEARPLAKRLSSLNEDRQAVEKEVRAAVLKELNKKQVLPWGIVTWGKEFHTGVIGIVAQRIAEKFYRPAAVCGLDESGLYKGSVRGIKGINVVKLLQTLSPFLVKWGGHAGAGGFAIEEGNLMPFATAFANESFTQIGDISGYQPVVEADTEGKLNEITDTCLKELERLAPFGVGNKTPIVLARGLTVVDCRLLKDQHLKVTLKEGRDVIEGVWWQESRRELLAQGTVVDVAFRLEHNNFMGNDTVQANIQAVEQVFL